MSITPPKYIQALKERDGDELVTRLQALADDWTAEAAEYRANNPPSAEEASVRADVRARALLSTASELRKVLDDFH